MRWFPVFALMFCVAGCGMPSLLITPVSNTSELQEISLKSGRIFGGKVAIIEVEGLLVDERSGGFLQAQENPLSLFVQELNQAAADDSVKAVVLRVNSPGGSVTTSDIMYDALKRFRQSTHKPVVACAQEVAASGAYYVSCGADKIVVNPTSIVGSIGVIFETFDFEGTLDKIGARTEAIKSAPLKDMGSPFRHLTPEAREIMQGMVDEYYGRFKNVVFTNRSIKDPATMTLVTDGRVFSGDRAVELGLADQTGRLDDAIQLACKMAAAPNAEVVMYKRPYGYAGSIYAQMPAPMPQSNDMTLKLPTSELLPGGFYYLWEP
jgi:protease-4